MTSLLVAALLAADAGAALDAGRADAGVADAGVTADSGIPSPTWAQRLVGLTSEGEHVEQLLDDGVHVRFGTRSQGPVHVWRPRGLKAEKADVVVYLHGFFTDVDQAMFEHQLARQFRDSGRPSVFIVPEARSWATDPFYWESLDALLDAVSARLGLTLAGKVTVVGHSGAYRPISSWLSSARLSRVVLLDGLYGADDDFHAWLSGPDGDQKQLVLVGFETSQRTGWFLARYPETARLDEVPYLFDKLPPALAGKRLVWLPTHRFDHMGLVTQGLVLPWLLHVLP